MRFILFFCTVILSDVLLKCHNIEYNIIGKNEKFFCILIIILITSDLLELLVKLLKHKE